MLGSSANDAFEEALVEDDPVGLYERAPCGYLSTTPDGTFIKVNQTFLDWTGYSREELRGRQLTSLLTAGGRIYHETHYAPMLRMQGSAREIALDLVTADGGRLPVLLNAVLELDPAGQPRVVRLAVFDATERREYERELLRAKQRAEDSEAHARALAQTLQQTLIPPTPPHVPGLDVAAVYRAAGNGTEVGGDFYDVFQVAEDDWVVVLGDVCGKGVSAAVVTALVRHTLRAVCMTDPQPASALRALNDVMLRQGTDRFSTALLIRLRRRDGAWQATVSAGGHPIPLRTRSGGEVEPVGVPGSLVGVLEKPSFTEVDAVLEPDDLLVLYTDGVPEGRRPDGEFYGDERLRRQVAAGAPTAGALARVIVDDVLDFQGGTGRDDIAVVTIRVPR